MSTHSESSIDWSFRTPESAKDVISLEYESDESIANRYVTCERKIPKRLRFENSVATVPIVTLLLAV